MRRRVGGLGHLARPSIPRPPRARKTACLSFCSWWTTSSLMNSGCIGSPHDREDEPTEAGVLAGVVEVAEAVPAERHRHRPVARRERQALQAMLGIRWVRAVRIRAGDVE